MFSFIVVLNFNVKIANQSADWCGNPPNEQNWFECYTKQFEDPGDSHASVRAGSE